MQDQIIKKYFYAANYLVILNMYLKKYVGQDIKVSDLKDINPGHLGTSTSINFLLANLFHFFHEKNLSHKLVIGEGHAGVSLISNLWLNGTLEKDYPTTIQGLNQLIEDFGVKIRSEINPQYPTTIYDGGELGYSLANAYGYSISSNEDIIPCIIGDGEAETGTLLSSFQLNHLIDSHSKVLPILNLNGLKMGSESYLSQFSDEELKSYFDFYGYKTFVVDATTGTIESNIMKMQEVLNMVLETEKPLIVFRSPKGYSLPKEFENNIGVHKNPLSGYDQESKRKVIHKFLKLFEVDMFDDQGSLSKDFEYFKTRQSDTLPKEYLPIHLDGISSIEDYLLEYFQKNDGLVFSPDELYSNMFSKLKNSTLELLNENVLQGLFQGYTSSGNVGFYISYEGFMPILDSMVEQYYKYLKQNSGVRNSMNYILTSTCFENTYSHQNPGFVTSLLLKDDEYYHILYPKDKKSAVRCLDYALSTKNMINVITTSKRHTREYSESFNDSVEIEMMKDSSCPEIVFGVTGDYMLDKAFDLSEELGLNSKIVYVTNPKVLDQSSRIGLSDEEFSYYFNPDVPFIYLYSGYPAVIKSLLYERGVRPQVFGYNDEVSYHFNDIINTNNKQLVKGIREKVNYE